MTRFDAHARERDLDEEIRVHLEMAVRERVARGESHADAERAALAEFGNVDRVKSAARAAWGGGASGSAPALELTANDRLKQSFRTWFWASMIVAALVHSGMFALWPEMVAAVETFESDPLEVIAPPDIAIPAPPEEIAKPALPIPVSDLEVSEELTIESTSWDQYTVDQLPPPPTQTAADVSNVPPFTPFTVGPEVLNRAEVARAMEREYPPLLRDANIGGTVKVYFFVDERGRVADRRIHESSTHPSLDEAALAVAEAFRFRPALNRDQQVAVWVSIPIVFRVQ